MKARLLANLIATGDSARNYLRLVRGPRRHPPVETLGKSRREAQTILETIQDQNQPDELDINIGGQTLINQMDADLQDLGLIPYWYSELARSRGEGIYPGVLIVISGDPARKRYRTTGISFRRQAIRMKDAEGNEFVLPWEMGVPVVGQEADRPYWFTALARDRDEDLQVGDYVSVAGTDEKYELTDVLWEYGEVEVRVAGSVEYQVMPWKHIRPWGE
jgi:hypothetical protein